MSHRRASVYAPAPRIHVLAADDNVVNRSMVEAVLSRCAAVKSYTLAGSYGETIRTLAETVQSGGYYGLVLLDIDLGPGRPTGGLEIAHQIRDGLYGQELMGTYVVAVTSDYSISNVCMYREARMDGCVAKPFLPETLSNIVMRLAQASYGCVARGPFFVVDRTVGVSVDPLDPIVSVDSESAVDDVEGRMPASEPIHRMRRSDAGAHPHRRSLYLDGSPARGSAAVPAYLYEHPRPRAFSTGAFSAGAAGQHPRGPAPR